MPMSKNATASQKQAYNKRWYARKVIMDTLEARLWEAFRAFPKGHARAKFVVWRDKRDFSRFHVSVNVVGKTKAPPMAWMVDLFFPEHVLPGSGTPYLGDPVLTVWEANAPSPLLRITGATNRQLGEYASDAIVASVLETALHKM